MPPSLCPRQSLTPLTASVKLDATPAITLDGRICSIVGPLVIATFAVAEREGSATLVAITEIEFGDGANCGAA